MIKYNFFDFVLGNRNLSTGESGADFANAFFVFLQEKNSILQK